MAISEPENLLELPGDENGVPLLETGDHLTRAEFHRLYAQLPQVKKAELIEGIVYMGSPVSTDGHGTPHMDLVIVLGTYKGHTPHVSGADNATVILDEDNELQPDAFLRIEQAAGGQSARTEAGYIEGPPELVAEISRSTVSIDRNAKLQAYRRNGVREYLIWRVRDQAVDWFSLENGQYQPLPVEQGIVRSKVFPGLWLDVAALLEGNIPRLLEVLNQGLQSPEHQAFVERLRQRVEAKS